MKVALILFNGIQFHHSHVNHAIEWVIKNNARLHGVFAHSIKEPPEGYFFPSDIDPAEDLYSKKDAARSNERVLLSQIKLLTDMAKAKNVLVETEELLNPALKQMISMTGKSDILFIDAAHNQAFLLAVTSFNFTALIEQSKCPVELVRDNE